MLQLAGPRLVALRLPPMGSSPSSTLPPRRQCIPPLVTMDVSMDAKKAAAEARRQKILARGRDRLAQITGSAPTTPAPAVDQPQQPKAKEVEASTTAVPSLPMPTPPRAAAAAAPIAASPPAAEGTTPGQASPAAAAAGGPRPEDSGGDGAALAAGFAAALHESRSMSELSETSSVFRQRKAGTAGTGAKWTAYAAPPPPAATAGQRRHGAGGLAFRQPLSLPDALVAAVNSTALLRLAVAALLAVLTAGAVLHGSTDGGGGSSSFGVWRLPEAWQPAWAALEASWAQQMQRLPPLASLVLLDVGMIAAACLCLRSVPGLARSVKVGGGGQGSLLMRAAALVPGLSDGLALLAAWQRAVAGVMDDVAMFVVALVLCNLAPALAARS